MGPASFLRDVILLAVIAHVVMSAAVDFRLSASTIAPFDDLPPDFEAKTDATEASKSQELFDNSEDITFINSPESEIAQIAEFAVPRPSLMEVEELLKRGEIKLNETLHEEENEKSSEETDEVVKISGDVTTTRTPPSTTVSTMPTTLSTTVTTTTTTAHTTTTATTTIRPTTVSTTTKPTTVVSTTTTTTTAKPTPTTLPERILDIDFRGIPRELLTSEEIEQQERQEDEELQKALKLLPEKAIGVKKLQEETFIAFSEREESETVKKAERERVPKDEAVPKVVETSKTVVSLNNIEDEEKEKNEKLDESDMLTSSVAPVIVELRTKAATATTMVPAGQFARNMPHTFEQFTFQVGRNFVPRTVFEKPKDGVSALIDMAIPQLSKTTAVPLIGKEMFDINLPARVPEFATITTSTSAVTTARSTTPATTTTAATTRRETTTADFKFPFAIPDGIDDDEKKQSIEESLKEIKDAFKRIRQLVKEDGKEDAAELTSAEEDIPPPPTNPTTVSTTTSVPTTVLTTTPSTTTTTTVPSTTTTEAKKEESSTEELITAGERPSWLDLSVFADNHHSLTTTTASASSTTTITEEPTTAATEPPPKEALVMQLFAVSEKKKDEMKEAQEKKMKESEFGGNLFDEIAERGDADRFSTAAPRSTSRSFAPPPVPPLPTTDLLSGIIDEGSLPIRPVTRRSRDQSTPPKAPSLQQEVLPKAFSALVEDLEIEAETERERKQLMVQLKTEEAQQQKKSSRPRSSRPTPSTTTAAPSSFLDGALTNEVEQFFEDARDSTTEKIRKIGRVGHRRRLLKGKRRLSQNGDLSQHSRIVRTQKRLVLVPEEEEIGKWIESQERRRLSKQPQAAEPPIKGLGRTTPPPVFSIGDPAKMRTTPGPFLPLSITSRPYFNVNSRMHVQQLQPQPDGSIAVHQFEMEGPEHVRPLMKERRAIVEPRLPSHASHAGASDRQSARVRDYESAMQRVASQIADKLFPTTQQPQQVQPIRPVPLSPPRHSIRIGKKMPLASKRTIDSNRIIAADSERIDNLDPRTIDPRTVRVRNRRNKHVMGISKRRRYSPGKKGAAAARNNLTVVHADPSLPAGAIEIPGLIRGDRSIHDGEPRITSRASPIMPPVLHPLVVDRNYDRQTIDRDIRL